MSVKTIRSLSDLLKHLKNDIKLDNGPAWYRGQSDKSWPLRPHYHRISKPPTDISLLNKFRQNANLLITAKQPINDFEWLFLMQHYGVPTRMLDWTESPLVALYFAIEPENKKVKTKDGALWILYPYLLNNNTNEREQNYIPAFEEDDFLGSYTVEKYNKGTDKGILPIAAIATRNNPRIQAQLGVFTISHRDKTPIEEIGDKKHIAKYIVPKDAKERLLKELHLLGIDKFQLFPELSVIGETIRREIL